MQTKDRAHSTLNLAQYNKVNKLDCLSKVYLKCPLDRQYILRMLIRKGTDDFKVPPHLSWIARLLNVANEHQKKLNVKHSFCYVTIRHGVVTTKTDDEWHTDGFSMNITHIPEQNYVWTNIKPTEYVEKAFDFPDDFDPSKHNINKFFQNRIEHRDIKIVKENNVYCMDPYIVHRRPTITDDMSRTFIRISFLPIEINDVNNSQNDLLPRLYEKDGVKEFRNKLVDYDLDKIDNLD